RIGFTVCFKRPNLHFTKSLSTELGFTAERLLGYKRVRTRRASVQLVINHMGQLEHEQVTYRYTAVKRLTRSAVIKDGFGIFRHTGFFQCLPDIFFRCSVKYRGGYV